MTFRARRSPPAAAAAAGCLYCNSTLWYGVLCGARLWRCQTSGLLCVSIVVLTYSQQPLPVL